MRNEKWEMRGEQWEMNNEKIAMRTENEQWATRNGQKKATLSNEQWAMSTTTLRKEQRAKNKERPYWEKSNEQWAKNDLCVIIAGSPLLSQLLLRLLLRFLLLWFHCDRVFFILNKSLNKVNENYKDCPRDQEDQRLLLPPALRSAAVLVAARLMNEKSKENGEMLGLWMKRAARNSSEREAE